jgi:hypothetical protein
LEIYLLHNEENTPMTKREFIKRLHLASPKFAADLKTVQETISSINPNVDDDRARLGAQLNEFEKKWPRVQEFIKWPTFEEWTKDWGRQDWNEADASLTDLKTVFFSLRGELEQSQQIEIDPAQQLNPVMAATLGKLTGGFGQTIADNLFGNNAPEEAQRLKSELRRSAGEKLFSKAAIVIPIYPETNKDDIDWKYVEQMKTLLYGSAYRPDDKEYETIIKVFAAGQLLESGKGYSTWQAIADAFRLALATVRYMYNRAHAVVYGHSGKKRRYKSDNPFTSATVAEVLKDDGPTIREKLTSKGKIENYKRYGFRKGEDGISRQAISAIFEGTSDGIREKCSVCGRFVAASDGDYRSDPERPHNEIFTCSTCLNPSD